MVAEAEGEQETAAYLSLGSNLGDRRQNLEAALKRLRETPGVRIVKVSRTYRSAAWGVEDQPEFLNLAAEIRTTLAPRALLGVAKNIERALGRAEGRRWGPRVIDIDILTYDRLSVEEGDLVLPHPRMAERAFVMAPLAEIAPELELPDGRRAQDIASALKREQRVDADI